MIRFREAAWKPKKGPKSKSRKIGERVLTAEVLQRMPGGWVRLKVIRSETTNAEDWCYTIRELETGSIERRALATILRGKPMRLEWTDETARAAVLGRTKPWPGLGKFI